MQVKSSLIGSMKLTKLFTIFILTFIIIGMVFTNNFNIFATAETSYTLGYTTIGGTNAAVGTNQDLVVYNLTSPATFYALHIYVSATAPSSELKLAIYSGSSTKPIQMVAQTDTIIVSNTTGSWVTANLLSNYTASIGYYWLTMVTNNTSLKIYFDAVATNQWAYRAMSYPNFPTISTVNYLQFQISMYADYVLETTPGTKFGYQEIGVVSANNDATYQNAIRAYLADDNATIYAISMYVACNQSSGITLGLYNDSSGSPSNLLAQTVNFTNIFTGWITRYLPTPILLNKGYYWISYVANVSTGFGVKYSAGETNQWAYSTSSYPNLKSSFGSMTNLSFRISLYANYVTNGVIPPSTPDTGFSIQTLKINGLHDGDVKIMCKNNADSSTPIVIMANGLGGLMTYTATLQQDIATHGYVTVNFDAEVNANSTQFVINEKSDLDILANWVIANISVGNVNNILLFGQSAGGGCALTFGNDSRFKAIETVVAANMNVTVPINTKPVFVMVGQSDSAWRSSGIGFYNNSVVPKVFYEIRNGTHALGITDNVGDTLPTSYTPIVENYLFAWMDYYLKGNQTALSILTVDSLQDYNIDSVSLELNSSITASASAGVNLSPSGTIVVAYNGSQSFTYSAQDGYRINSVLVDGVAVTDTGTYLFSDITSNHTFVVSAITSVAYRTTDQAINNCYIALGLVSVSLIVLACVLIMGSVNSSDGDTKGLLIGVSVLVSSVVLLILGILVINGFASSMGLWLLQFLHI